MTEGIPPQQHKCEDFVALLRVVIDELLIVV